MAFYPCFPYSTEDAHLIEQLAGTSSTVDDGGLSLTVDTDDGSLSAYHKPDYSILSADTKPTPDTGNEGVTLEETDTGDRFRWTGLIWVQTHASGIEILVDFYFEVARGVIKGHTPINIIGHDDAIGTTLATIGNEIGSLQTYSTAADIDSISSSDAGDTHDITIEGLDINYNAVAAQTVTLNGQNRVAIPISLLRITKIYNATGTETLGAIWVYVDTALTAGKPTDLTKIRSSIHRTAGSAGPSVSNEIDSNSVYTIPAGKTGYVVFGKMTVSDAKAIELTFWSRSSGGVFFMVHHIDVKNNNYDYFFKLPGKILEKSDIEVRASVDTGTADVSAAYDIILVDN